MNNKLNKLPGGIFFSVLLAGFITQILLNLMNFNYPWYLVLPIGILIPGIFAYISAQKLYDYFTIEKLEKELKMED